MYQNSGPSQPNMPSIVKMLKVVADPNRLRILLLLKGEELSVAELQEILVMGQSTISTHLSQLKQAGLVEDRRTGKSNLYRFRRRDGENLFLDEFFRMPRTKSPKPPRPSRHAPRPRKRQDKMRSFFDSVAGRLGKDYVPGKSWKGVAEALLRLIPPMVIADLGAGEGAFALLLAQRAKKVIAVDTSAKMIEVGREQALRHGVKNIDFRLGDMEEIPIGDAEVDLVFFSQSAPSRPASRARPRRRPAASSPPAAASSSSTSSSTALKKPAKSTPTSGSASARPNWNPCSKNPASPTCKPQSFTRNRKPHNSRPSSPSPTSPVRARAEYIGNFPRPKAIF